MIVDPSLSHLAELYARFARISIVGVGDEGNDILSHIFEEGGSGAQCLAINTDTASLEHVYSHEKVSIEGRFDIDRKGCDRRADGLGTIQECARLVTPLLVGSDVAFIIVKAAELDDLNIAAAVATVARQTGAVTVGLAVLPPNSRRDEELIVPHLLARMRQNCHTLAIIDSNRSAQLSEYTHDPSAGSADQLVVNTVSGLSQALACPSAVNIELRAFRELMMHGGIAHVGIANSSSSMRIEEATMGALRGPMLFDDITRCRGALINVRGDSNLRIDEAERAAQLIARRAGWNVPTVMGATVDESWYEGCQVSLLLTGGVYPYIPGGYRRLPLDMDEMESDGEEEGPINLELDLDQLE